MPTRYRVEDLGPLPTAALAAPWREAAWLRAHGWELLAHRPALALDDEIL